MLSFLRELPVLLLVAFVLAFLLRTFIVQVFYIPSSSMEETLQVNDRMIVEKVSFLFREPHRGEVIVFEGDELVDESEQSLVSTVTTGVGRFLGLVPANARDFVKRVIAFPGEVVLVRGGVVSVDGVELTEPYVTNVDVSDFGPLTVPDDELFVMGDNRPNSADSRSTTLGPVLLDHVVGRATTIIWPLDHTGGIGDYDLDVQAPRG
jgi:signal peptidase I